MSLIPDSTIDPDVLEQLRDILSENGVSTLATDRILYARDMNAITNNAHAVGDILYPPAAVVWPETTEQLSEICKLAYQHEIPIIPFGAGSGVCGGTWPIHGEIIVDVKKMNKIIDIDDDSLLVTAQAGIMGETFERELAHRGYTMGHFPSSIYCSTLGGWAAARSAGQFSGKYGKIEDMVVGMEMVLPQGQIVNTLVTPRHATGPDWNKVMIGSEGTLGFITKLTCRIWPAPQSRRFVSFLFRDAPTGIEAMRVMFRNDIRPAGLRLYDELDTALVGTSSKSGTAGSALDFLPINEWGNMIRGLVPNFFKKTGNFLAKKADWINKLERFARQGCLLVLTLEGEERLVNYEHEAVTAICENLGGINRGPELAVNWYKNRYHVSYKQSKVFYNGAYVDTIEVATTWDKVARLYEEVRAALTGHAFIMAHFSHAYQDGCSIYFTFVTSAGSAKEVEQSHKQIWDLAMAAVFRVGGTFSHHHGVGLTKARYMETEHHSAMKLYQAIKDELDPKNLCNPGKMGLKP